MYRFQKDLGLEKQKFAQFLQRFFPFVLNTLHILASGFSAKAISSLICV